MKTALPSSALIFLMCILSGPGAQAATSSEAATRAAEACESAVTDTIKEMRGAQAKDVQYIAAQRALKPSAGESTDVKGAGSYRGASSGAMSFTYSCAYNAETNATSGIVFKETGQRAAPEPAWQPDLSSVSPEACETAIAATLKSKYPRVGRIAFGSDSRQLRPASEGHSSLEGQGAVERAPGMSLIPFKYRCEFEPRSGRIVAAQTSD